MYRNLRTLYVRILKKKWKVLKCTKTEAGVVRVTIVPGGLRRKDIMNPMSHIVVRLRPNVP